MAKINVQMYSFMEGFEVPYDNETVFRTAAELGFDGVEIFGPNFGMGPERIKELTEELKLDVISMHVPSSDKVIEMIPFAKALDMKFIGIGMELMRNDEEVHAFAKRLNEMGEECAKNGLTLTYHNHTQEFAPCESKTIWDTLMDETNPEFVSFELDAGWAAAAGVDPIEIIEKYSGRVKLVHIKESDMVIGPQPPHDFGDLPKDENGFPMFTKEQKENMLRDKKLNCPAGKGLVDWAKLKKIADANGCQGYSVEREATPDIYETRKDALAADVIYYKSIL